MSKKISVELANAILAMQKDPSKLVVDINVRVYPCPEGDSDHLHYTITSPFVQNGKMSEQVEGGLMIEAKLLGAHPAPGDYRFCQSYLDGTKCLNSDELDPVTVQFLLGSSVIQSVLLGLSMHLRHALVEWPTELETEQMLSRAYAETLRKKIWNGSNADPILVRVMGENELTLERLGALPMRLLGSLFGAGDQPMLREQNNALELFAFSDDNPCAPVVRQAYAAYAQTVLDQKIEPEIAPKIVGRVGLVLETLKSRLEKQTVSVPTNVPTAQSGGASEPVVAARVTRKKIPQSGTTL